MGDRARAGRRHGERARPRLGPTRRAPRAGGARRRRRPGGRRAARAARTWWGRTAARASAPWRASSRGRPWSARPGASDVDRTGRSRASPGSSGRSSTHRASPEASRRAPGRLPPRAAVPGGGGDARIPSFPCRRSTPIRTRGRPTASCRSGCSRTTLGRVRTIVAPSVTWNEIRGVTGTFRYFLYASAFERLELIASYSEKIDRELKVQYKNLDVFGGRFHTDLQFLHERVSSIRFFGIGPSSKQADESNMTLETTGGYAIFGVNMTPTMRLSLGETLQRFEVDRGGVPGLPFTGDLFPDLPGVEGATIHAQRVALIHDSRDSLTTPTQGLYVSVFAEASTELLGSDADYIKAGAEGRFLKPFLDRRVVMVAAGALRGHLRGVERSLPGAAHAGRGRHPARVRREPVLRGRPVALQCRGARQRLPRPPLRRQRGAAGRAFRRRRQGLQLDGAVPRHALRDHARHRASAGWRRRASSATSSSRSAGRGRRSTSASTTPSRAVGDARRIPSSSVVGGPHRTGVRLGPPPPCVPRTAFGLRGLRASRPRHTVDRAVRTFVQTGRVALGAR